MSDERLALHRMTRAAWHGIRMAGQNRPQLTIPPQPGDDDMILAAVIDERDALLEKLGAAQEENYRLGEELAKALDALADAATPAPADARGEG